MAAPGLAATQGSLGAPSTGSALIQLGIGLIAVIRRIDDLVMGSWSGAGDLAANDDVCIGTNSGGNYAVLLSGSGAGGAFTLTNGSQTLAYNAFWNDQTGTAGRMPVSPNSLLTGQTGAGGPFGIFLCFFGSTVNANVSAVIPEANLQAASASAFTGALTITVVPE
jgi:hypothetical protein